MGSGHFLIKTCSDGVRVQHPAFLSHLADQFWGTTVLVPRCWCPNLVPKLWLRFRYQDFGTKFVVPRLWYQYSGTKFWYHKFATKSWYQDFGTKMLVPQC